MENDFKNKTYVVTGAGRGKYFSIQYLFDQFWFYLFLKLFVIFVKNCQQKELAEKCLNVFIQMGQPYMQCHLSPWKT